MTRRQNVVKAAMLATLAGLPATALSQQVYSNYVGPSGGAWHNALNWDHGIPDAPGEVPLIHGGSYVVLSGTAVVDKIGIETGGTIGINNGSVLGVRTTTDNQEGTGIFGGGITGMSSVGNGTYIRLYGATGSWATFGSLAGPSTIQMSASTANIIDGTSVGIIFNNDGVIEGAGQIGNGSLVVANRAGGRIRAIYPQALILNPSAGGLTNEGAMIADNGYMVLSGSTFTGAGAGEIDVSGANALIDLSACTLVNCRLKALTTPSGIFRTQSSPNLVSCTLSAPLHVPNANLMYLSTSLDTAGGGHLYLDSVGNGTYLRLLNNVQLTGNGTIAMGDSAANIIDGNVSGLTLTNDMPNGIVGSGNLGNGSLRIVNNTNIYASGSAGLRIAPSAGGLTNNGTLWALTGSTLYLASGSFDNTNHFIEVQPGAVCVITSSTVTGGTLQSFQPGGYFSAQSSSVLNGIATGQPTVIDVPNAHLVYLQGTLTNAGTMNLSSVGNGTYFRLYGDVTLNGTGVLASSNTTANIIDAQVTGQRLTNNSTIRGSFNLGDGSVALTNNGAVEASGSNGLVVYPAAPGCDNNGVLRALTGSSLTLSSNLFDNAGGLIEVQDGASCRLISATIAGGTLRSFGSGSFYAQSNSVLNGFTLEGSFSIPNANLVYLQSSLTNNGTFTMASVGNGTYLRVYGDSVLNGAGVLTSSNTTANIIDAQVAGQRLTNNSTIRGSFNLGNGSLALVNNGVVEASGSSGLTIYPGTPSGGPGCDNNGVLRALTGSSLRLSSSTFDSTGGLVEVQDGASCIFLSATITGGTLRTLGTGSFYAQGSSVLGGFTLDGSLSIPNANLAFLQGTLTNNGTFTMDSIGNATHLRLLGDAVLAGGGTFATSNTTANIIDANSVGFTLTSYNTIRGSGAIGNDSANIINRGSIIADASAGMVINPASSVGLVNEAAGVISVQGLGLLTVGDGPFTTAGTITIDASRLLRRISGHMIQTGGTSTVNGELRCEAGSVLLQGGRLGGNGLVNASTSNLGGTVAPGSSPGNLTIQGAYNQGASGTLEVELNGLTQGTQFDHLAVTGTAALDGTLSVKFLSGYAPAPGASYRFLDTTGTSTGTFASISLTGAPANIGAVVQYDGHGATLTLVRTCGSPDFNCDGDIGTDSDIEAFFRCLSGFCPTAPCTGTADFNGDGDVGTDADIAAFFRVLGGGNC